jgi:hypothetical protein
MCYEIYIAPNKPLKTIQWGENNRKLYVSWEGEKEKGPLKTICLTEKDVGRQFNLSPTSPKFIKKLQEKYNYNKRQTAPISYL